jgi:hypothetical protein
MPGGGQFPEEIGGGKSMGWVVVAFVAGEIAGLITAAIISGTADRIREWRKQRHERKKFQDYYRRIGNGDRGAGLSEHKRR